MIDSSRQTRQEPRRPSYSVLAFALIYLFLGVFIPLHALSGDFRGETSELFWLAILIAQYSAIRLAHICASGSPHIISMTFYIFVYVWVGWAGSIQLYLMRFPWRISHAHEDIAPALIIILLTIVTFDLGRIYYRMRHKSEELAGGFKFQFRISTKRILFITFLTIPCAIVGIVYFGGVEFLFSSRASFGEGKVSDASLAGVMLSRALLRTPSFVALVLAVVYTRYQWSVMSGHYKRLYILLIIALLMLNLVTNYPAAQARYWLGTVVLTPLFAILPWWRRKTLFTWLIILVISMIWVYPRSDVFRRAVDFDHAIHILENDPGTIAHVMSGDFDVFQMTINTVSYERKNDIFYGKNILGAFLFWYPRRLWPDKPQGTGYIIATDRGYRFRKLSSPFWTESFMAFGWFGVVIFPFLYGYVSGLGDRAFTNSLRSSTLTFATVAVPFWAAFQFFFLRGSLMVALSHCLFVLVLFIAATSLYTVRRNRKIPHVETGSQENLQSNR